MIRELAAVVILALPCVGNAADATVEWSADRLTVKAVDHPLQDLLRVIGEKTGTPMQGLENVEGRATAEFEKVPLAEALNRLMGRRGYAMSTLHKRPPGKSGIELQFPAKAAPSKGGPGLPAKPEGATVLEEVWVGADGKPTLEFKKVSPPTK
jgi:hypothetical protein